MVNRHQQFVLIQSVILGQQIPCVSDRFFFEVVTKTEVSQHFEKRVMARGVSNVIEVIMFTTCTNALLAGNCAVIIAALKSGKNILELHHARVGKHQRWIVAWNQRRAIDYRMTVRLKAIQKCAANIIQTGHDRVPLF